MIRAALYLAGLLVIFNWPAWSLQYPLDAFETTGVMRCVPAVNSASDFYDMYGCLSLSGTLTIKQFFDKYKRDKNDRILQIHYDSYQNLFHIYYGRMNGFPFPEGGQ